MQAKLSEILRAMSQAADLGEAKELGHAQRLCVLAIELARSTGAFNPQALAELAVAALLHDIGISSATHELHRHNGATYRTMLARYPAWPDGDFGATLAASDAFAPLVAQHVNMGVQVLYQLGYGDGATAPLALHHARVDGRGWPSSVRGAEMHLAGQVLAIADILESATYPLGTAEGRRQSAAALLHDMRGSVVTAELAELALSTLCTSETWERVIFFDEVEETLDALFATTYGLDVSDEGIEAHLRALAKVTDADSPYSSEHTLEVARLAQRVGERVGMDTGSLQRLYLGSLVHGVGRLGISSAIIQKGGGLTDEQIAELHAYPNMTREAMLPLVALRDVVDEASTHREKLDGSGYPERRVGQDIPLIGRILAVADTFVALISKRPYREAYSRSRALAIVQAESARLFDGLVTDAFEAVYREGL